MLYQFTGQKVNLDEELIVMKVLVQFGKSVEFLRIISEKIFTQNIRRYALPRLQCMHHALFPHSHVN